MTSNLAYSDDVFAAREVLGEKIARRMTAGTALDTQVPGLALRRYTAPTEPASYLHEPSVCLVAQGAKRVFLGEDEYVYDDNRRWGTSSRPVPPGPFWDSSSGST
jgi:hypothetical protein